MIERLKAAGQTLRREWAVVELLYRDERVPRTAKWLLGLAVTYLASPVDLIPDFIPVLGHLDDVLIVGGLVALAFRLVPSYVLAECRARARSGGSEAGTAETQGGEWTEGKQGKAMHLWRRDAR